MLFIADLCYFILCLQFEKPGKREKFDYPDMALEAGILLRLILEFVVILTVSGSYMTIQFFLII